MARDKTKHGVTSKAVRKRPQKTKKRLETKRARKTAAKKK